MTHRESKVSCIFAMYVLVYSSSLLTLVLHFLSRYAMVLATEMYEIWQNK